ncbi:MAG TPA: NCS2 family permease [Candidatus Saccharimonadales bacterium]
MGSTAEGVINRKIANRKRQAPVLEKLDAFFHIAARGSTVGREVRGGFVTFFAMAYIIVLNPIILASGVDKFGRHLGIAGLTTATALIAAIMTAMMGLGANLPLAIAAGLGLNGVLTFTIAPTMSWPDAMGLVVIEGIVICILVATGLRKAIMEAIPLPLKEAISAGIGLFIAFIGLVDSGFVTIPKSLATPVQLGATGQLGGWPIAVFCFGLLLMIVLMMKKIKGALLIGIVASTVLAVIINAVAKVTNWGTVTPSVPHSIIGAPNFSLIGHFSLFGGFAEAGIITGIVFVFTLFLSDFFDAMGTITGISNQAGLLGKKGNLPVINKALFIDGLAAVAGGAGSGSSNTAFVESSSGVGEGARTGLASVITALLFVVALFLTPLTTIVPSQAATPALIIVGFLMMMQAKNIPWDNFEIALPAFLALVLMPFTYSITNGIGAAVIAYVLLRTVNGKFKQTHWLLTAIAGLFVIYFFLSPIERLLNVG